MKEVDGRKAIEEQRRKAELGNKLTGTDNLFVFLQNTIPIGRQLFEQNKVTAASDCAFYDEAGLNIDEAVFEGMEYLDIDDDEGNDDVLGGSGLSADEQ